MNKHRGKLTAFILLVFIFVQVLPVMNLSIGGQDIYSIRTVDAASGFNPSEYSYKYSIAIDNSKVDSTLINYPIKVLLNTSNFDFAKSSSQGLDILFSDTADNLLDFEMVYFDSANSIAEYHVKVSSVSSTVDTEIYMYTGKSGVSTSLENPTAVWDSNYECVIHMGYASLIDSTGNHTLTITGTTLLTNTSYGKYRDFNGSSDYITAPVAINDIVPDFTAEAFVSKDFTDQMLLLMHMGAVNANGFSGHDEWQLAYHSWQDAFRPGAYDLSASTQQMPMYDYIGSGEHYLAARFNGMDNGDTTPTITSYHGNSSWDTTPSAATNYAGAIYFDDIQDGLYIGRAVADTRYFDGKVYEIRLSKSDRSAAWLKATWNMLNNNSSIVSLTQQSHSPAQTINASEYNNQFDISIDNTKIDSTLTDYPVKVLLNSSNFDFSKSLSNGLDIVFTDTSDELLDFEMVYFDSTNSIAEYHVKVPSVNSSADTEIYMYTGKSGVSTSLESPTAVWDSNFLAVWHLSDLSDSTDNNNNLTTIGSPVQGMDSSLGKYYDFERDNQNERLSFGTLGAYNNDLTVLTITTPESLTTNTTWQYSPVVFDLDGEINFKLTYANGLSADTFGSSIYTTTHEMPVYVTGQAATVNHMHAITYNKSTYAMEIFEDGTSGDTGYASSFITTDSTDNSIGASTGGTNRYFDGKIYEVQVSNIVRSDAWLKADYHNLVANNLVTITDITSVPVVTINPQEYTYQMTCTVDNTKIDSTLTEYPIKILLNTSNFDFSKSLSSGLDIAFSNTSNELLDFELVYFDAANSIAEYFVKIPTISSSADTEIYMYTGKSGVSTSIENPDDVWDGDFLGVWHMSGLNESTVNGLNLTMNGTPVSGTDASVGKYYDFERDNLSDYFTFGNLGIFNSDFSVTTVISPESFGDDNSWGISPVTVTFEAEINCFLTYGQNLDVNTYGMRLKNTIQETPAYVTGHSTGVIYGNSFTFNNTGLAVKAYDSGNLVSSGTATGSIIADTEFNGIGAKTNGTNRYFDGKIYEVQVSGIVRSDSWLKADYHNLVAMNLVSISGGASLSFNSGFESYGADNVDTIYQLNNATTKAGQSFTMSQDKKITGCEFVIGKTGNPTGYVTAAVYSHTGTFGSNGTPNSLLATSAQIDVTTLSSEDSVVSFSFTGANQFELDTGTDYFIVMDYQNGTATDYLTYGADNSTPTHAGNSAAYNTAWATQTYDIGFSIMGIDVFGDGSLQYDISNMDTLKPLNGTYTGYGQSIKFDDSTQLDKCKFALSKIGKPSGNLVVKVYPHSGTFGSTGIPYGTAIATSTYISTSQVSNSLEVYDFYFVNTNNIVLQANTDYFLVVEYTNGDAANYINVAADNSSPTALGNGAGFNQTWAYAAYDLCYYVYEQNPEETTQYNSQFLNIAVDDYTTLGNLTVKIQYTPGTITVKDLCAFTKYKDNDTGGITGTDIVVTVLQDGLIEFETTKVINSGTMLTGSINLIEYMQNGATDPNFIVSVY